MSNLTFGDFLLSEVRRRDISVREFANLMGVSHTTVLKFFEYGKKDVGYPSVDFLIRLARATETDLCTIIGLIAPDLVHHDPETQAIAEQLRQLPTIQRDMVSAYIRSITLDAE